MRDGIEPARLRTARIIVWVVLGAAFLSYLRWGSELISRTSFFQIRRSVPSIWNSFYQGLPEIANRTLLDVVYSIALATVIVGALTLIWLASVPSEDEVVQNDHESTST